MARICLHVFLKLELKNLLIVLYPTEWNRNLVPLVLRSEYGDLLIMQAGLELTVLLCQES